MCAKRPPPHKKLKNGHNSQNIDNNGSNTTSKRTYFGKNAKAKRKVQNIYTCRGLEERFTNIKTWNQINNHFDIILFNPDHVQQGLI